MRNTFQTSTILGAIVAMVAYASSCDAQVPFSNIPVDRPTISPYLQLLNTGNPNVNNYSLYVRPQIDAQNANRSQQEQIRSLQATQQQLLRAPQGLAVQGSRDIRTTGHETVYMFQSHFYPQVNRVR
jgi:hypothetical protein